MDHRLDIVGPPLMLLLADLMMDDRRRAAGGPLAPLLASLIAELEPLLGRELHIPREKALLSRAGGRCERDGATLEFDPFSPHSHRCPTCGTSFAGTLHDRSWITWYHLWLAERAVHGSLFHALTGDARYATLARDILRAYADVYLLYPNRDNVLGPTRPFFSTYLESIWLLQLCIAADLVQHAGDKATADIVRDRIVESSSDLIAEFNEGSSNRQVWNNAALIAAAFLLGDANRADALVRVKSGVADHLSHALLTDGTWFEGDNYHQFAIRGLWYAVTMCDANGLVLAGAQTRAFDRGIAATFASALPDFTFPSRKDSQYAVSLRQWRFAELAELGYARTRDEQIAGALARCYEPGSERRDTGRSRSTADAERNTQSSLLTRADLGWRALLHALPELPPIDAVEPRSVHLTGQGLAVFRRRGQVFVAMDYGQSGAGHGHPDRLNVLLAQGTARWLDDLGTGSYVEKTLHWYRSSLAHNAPFVNGQSQRSSDGALTAYDERGELGWVEAQFIDEGVKLTRTLVVTPRYFVDEIAWVPAPGARPKLSAASEPFIDVPWHVDAEPQGITLSPSAVSGGTGLEDGFDFATGWASADLPPGDPARLVASAGARALSITFLTKAKCTLLRGTAPGQPASKQAPFYMVRLHGAQGRLRSVVAWDPSAETEFDGERVVVATEAMTDVHSRTPTGWRIESTADRATKVFDLAGRVAPKAKRADAPPPVPMRIGRLDQQLGGWWSDLQPAQRQATAVFELGEKNYRRSEILWRDAGSPSATVALAASPSGVEIFVDVRILGQQFARNNADNPFDNEHPDTMGAGVQLYVGTDTGRAQLMLVPELGGERVRVREITGSSPAAVVARWRPRKIGYELHIVFVHGHLKSFNMDVVINDAVEGRDRRRGQLVTSDASGEFVYLRGDREDGSRALHFEVTP